jgi:hypothetical protein
LFRIRCSAFGVRRFHLQFFHRLKNRFYLHHHPLPSSERGIIHHVMFVGRPIAQIVNLKLERIVFLRPFHHAFI